MKIDFKIGRVFYITYSEGLGWFRIFGVVLRVKDTSRCPLLFSERYGYGNSKYIMVGNWLIGILTYRKM